MKRLLILILLIISIPLLFSCYDISPDEACLLEWDELGYVPDVDYYSGKVNVKFAQDIDECSVKSIMLYHKILDVEILNFNDPDHVYAQLTVEDGEEFNTICALEKDPHVIFADLEYIYIIVF